MHLQQKNAFIICYNQQAHRSLYTNYKQQISLTPRINLPFTSKPMFNNFIQHQYQPYHKIYTHPQSSYSLYLGDVSSALDMTFIATQPIHLVVTAATGMDQVQYDQGQVRHIVYPLLDAKSENITKFFNQFYALVEDELIKGNILVHCAAGISRSATLVISYFMKKNHWTFKEAVKFVRDKRPVVLPNLGFERQLKEYEHTMNNLHSNHANNNSMNRDSHTSEFQKRLIQTKDDQRKNLFSPVRRDLLPDIKHMGTTSILRSLPIQRSLPLEKAPSLRFDPDQIKQYTHKKFGDRMRHSEQGPKTLKKKGMHLGNLNKQLIYAKIQSGRSKLLQRSSNMIYMNFPTDNSTFYQEPMERKQKKLSSLSHRSERKNREHKLVRNYSNEKQKRAGGELDELNRVIVSKLQLNERKFATEKNLKTRAMHRAIGQF